MKQLKRLGVVGAGNVGSALIMELARINPAEGVTVVSRTLDRARAAILDAGSAFPENIAQFSPAQSLNGEYDTVVVTAGKLPASGISQKELLEQNLQIVRGSLATAGCKTLIVIGTPVDELTEKLSRYSALQKTQVIGFGGELDRARTRFALIERGIRQEPVYVIGEHGPRAIPVYPGLRNYEAVKAEMTSVLKKIKQATGSARNLATGVQLSRLVRALAGESQIMCVSAPHSDYDGLSLTWPRVINENGVGVPLPIKILAREAKHDLKKLLEIRTASSS